MKTKDAISYFKSQSALARALGIRPPSVAGWGEVVPELRQLQIEAITGGQLKADERVRNPMRAAA